MTDCLLDLLLEFDEMGFSPTIPCKDIEETAIKWKEQVVKEIESLEAENAALRDRLERSVELPVKIGDKAYMPWVWDGISGIAELKMMSISIFATDFLYVTDLETDDTDFFVEYNCGQFESCDFGVKVFTTRESAEARLAELKGEKE